MSVEFVVFVTNCLHITLASNKRFDYMPKKAYEFLIVGLELTHLSKLKRWRSLGGI